MRRLALAALGLLAVATLLALILTRGEGDHVPAHSASGPTARSPAAAPAWLGLNGNSSYYLGPVDRFARAGIRFDRNFELTAGSLPGDDRTGGFERRLETDAQLGMSPVSVIEYDGYDRPGFEFQPDPRFPGAGEASVSSYVRGFLRTAIAVRALAARLSPRLAVRFEVMNEPWANTFPAGDGAQYAHVIAALLPAAAAAGIPLGDIYVAVRGEGWLEAMYRAEPALRSEIAGFYLHTYEPETIGSLPQLRASMGSGRDNVIVSELGFCARDVNNPGASAAGTSCHGAPAVPAREAAAALAAALERALVFHREGWLKALIVYSRNDGGWAMQLPGGALTPSGRALLLFAEANA